MAKGMDKQTFTDWFTGGEQVGVIDECSAREFISEMSAENGAEEVTADEMDTYIWWLREDSILA